ADEQEGEQGEGRGGEAGQCQLTGRRRARRRSACSRRDGGRAARSRGGAGERRPGRGLEGGQDDADRWRDRGLGLTRTTGCRRASQRAGGRATWVAPTWVAPTWVAATGVAPAGIAATWVATRTGPAVAALGSP